MSTTTPNLHLVKPTDVDLALIGVLNGNADLIDAAYESLNTSVSGAATAANLTAEAATRLAADNALDARLDTLEEAWVSYDALWTAASVNPTLGNGSIVAAYNEVGKTVDVRIVITIGSTTNPGTGQFSVSLPVAPKTGPLRFATDFFNVSQGAAVSGMARWYTGTTIQLWAPPTSAGTYDRASSGAAQVPFLLAAGDSIAISGRYERT